MFNEPIVDENGAITDPAKDEARQLASTLWHICRRHNSELAIGALLSIVRMYAYKAKSAHCSDVLAKSCRSMAKLIEADAEETKNIKDTLDDLLDRIIADAEASE